jgi:uncharacterized protein
MTFWDTSAVIPLIMEEPHSASAIEIWQDSEAYWAWDWVHVEGEAALTRQSRTPEIWKQWLFISQQIHCVSLQPHQHASLRMMNRGLGLRAADAGHVYVFDRLLEVLPDLMMVSFDQEMLDALDQLGLPVHPGCRTG